jgi:hypothetical protein
VSAGRRHGEQGKRGDGSVADWAELEAQLRELEVLMEVTDVPPPLLSTYWELSADLIALLEEMGTILPAVRGGLLAPAEARTRYRDVRQRVLSLQARAQEITLDVQESGGLESW